MRTLILLAVVVLVGCGSPSDPAPERDAQPAAAAVVPALERDAQPAAAAVVHVHENLAWRESPPRTGRVLPLLQGNNAFVASIELDPGAVIPAHRDPTEEYIVVLDGYGVMTLDGVEHPIGPHSAVFMPAGAEVSFVAGERGLSGLQVFAGPESAAKYDAWSEVPSTISQRRVVWQRSAAMVDQIRTAEKAYYAEYEAYVELPACPSGWPGRDARPWDCADDPAWQALRPGTLPDEAFCTYEARFREGVFTMEGRCDHDGDGVPRVLEATLEQRTRTLTGPDVH